MEAMTSSQETGLSRPRLPIARLETRLPQGPGPVFIDVILTLLLRILGAALGSLACSQGFAGHVGDASRRERRGHKIGGGL